MRKKLFSIIESAENDSKLSNVYDFIMMVTIVVSVVPRALYSSIFKILTRAGKIISPPPAPKNPLTNPPKIPII